MYNRSYLQYLVPRILKHPRPPLSSDWDKVMISWVYIQMHQRARTRLTWVHQGRGRRGGILALAHLSSTPPLPGHRPSQNSSGGFHNLQCCQRKFDRSSAPRKILAATPFTCQATSIITLSGAYIGVSLHLRCLWDLENDRWGHKKAPDAMIWKDGPNFPKVSCLANNFLLQDVEHFYKEWVCWLLPGEEERLILSYNYPLLVTCLLKISDNQSYNQIFVNKIWSE